MGKTLTITDDDLGARASVRIEQTDGGQPIITLLQFEGVDGHGLTSAALGLMEDLGLHLPQQAPMVKARKKAAPAKKTPAARKPARRAPATVPAQTPAADNDVVPPAGLGGAAQAPALPAAAPPSAEPAARPAAPAAPHQRRYRSGPPPSAAELREVFRRHRGNHQAIAEEMGAGVSTVANWLRKAREGGETINLVGLDDETAGRP